MIVTTIGADPARIDIDVHAGEPIDFTIPVLDATGAAQTLAGWTLAAQVRARRGSELLHTFALAAVAGGVRVTAGSDDTAGWTDWPPAVRWDLWLTPPASESYPLAAGWVRVRKTITH